MSHECRVAGCPGTATSGFSPYCRAHKAALRRHGHPEQSGVTAGELRPYLLRVRRRIERNHNSPVWTQLEANWLAVSEHARAVLCAFERGTAGPGYERSAAFEIDKISSAAKPRQVVEVVLAVFLMQGLDPRRFRSDAAFRFQLARRVRALADVHAATMYDHGKGGVRRIYRELAPRAVAVLGQWLAEMSAGAGIRIAALELDDERKQQEQRRTFAAALGELK